MSNIKRSTVFKLVCVSAISGMLLTGCTEDSRLSNNPDPTVEYKENVAGENNLAQYGNADWLYQNYFGEYGLPDVLKDELMTVLMMLANGFALQHSRGEDVEASISELHTAMQMMYHSGQLGSSVQQMLEQHNTEVYNATKTVVLTETQIEEILLNNPLILSEEAQKNVDESNRRHEMFLKEQEQLVIDHNLPYALPDMPVKYLIIGPDQFWFGRWLRKRDRNNNNNPAKPRHKNIDSWAWSSADIIWTNALSGIGHVGMVSVEGWDNVKVVVDANNPWGVREHRKGLDNWANTGGWSLIEGWRFVAWESSWFIDEEDDWYKAYNRHRWNNRRAWSLEKYRRWYAMDYAYNKVGVTSYNVFVGKNSNNPATYCSLLVWSAYNEIGIDIDRNRGSIVWPFDITNHRFITKFKSSEI